MSFFKIFKKPAYKFVKYIVNSDFFRREFWYAFEDILRNTYEVNDGLSYVHNPYDHQEFDFKTILRKKPIFLTGRFRSGSTFLWLIFRNIPFMTAYYEPLNENKWFLGQKFKVDPSHVGVTDYWREYQGLNFLDNYFKLDWSFKKLYMTSKDYDILLFRYICYLIEHAKGRPVLQFNRIDFRLPWIKSYFPSVPIVYIYRNPREQWMSILRDGGPVSPDFIIQSDSCPNLFYTIIWAHDLKKIFPFLEPLGQHPYSIHYYLWRLSFIFASSYADYLLSYESLVNNFDQTISDLFDFLEIQYDNLLLAKLRSLNKGKISDKWKSYASLKWFQEKEKECELVLKNFFK